jgi:hypothetical protein
LQLSLLLLLHTALLAATVSLAVPSALVSVGPGPGLHMVMLPPAWEPAWEPVRMEVLEAMLLQALAATQVAVHLEALELV